MGTKMQEEVKQVTVEELLKMKEGLTAEGGNTNYYLDPAYFNELQALILSNPAYAGMTLQKPPQGADAEISDPKVDPRAKARAKRRGRLVPARRVIVFWPTTGTVQFVNCEVLAHPKVPFEAE